MQEAATITVTGAPERPQSAGRWRLIARNAFPFLVVGAIWEIVAWAGVFPHRLFPTLEEVALSFVQLDGLRHSAAPRHRDRDPPALRLHARRRVRRRHRRADRTLAARRRHLPAAGVDLRADPWPRLCAAVSALVRAGQFFRRAAGRLRVGVSGHLQQLDRRQSREGNLGALGAIDGRRRPPAVQPRHPAGRAALHPHRVCGSAWRRPGAFWSRSKCWPPCPGGSAG